MPNGKNKRKKGGAPEEEGLLGVKVGHPGKELKEEEGEKEGEKEEEAPEEAPSFRRTAFPNGFNPLRSEGQPRSVGERYASSLTQAAKSSKRPWTWWALGIIGFGIFAAGVALLPLRILGFISKAITWAASGKNKPEALTWKAPWENCKAAFSAMRDKTSDSRVKNFFKGIGWGILTFFTGAGTIARGVMYTGAVLMHGQGDVQDQYTPHVDMRINKVEKCDFFPYTDAEKSRMKGAQDILNGKILSEQQAKDIHTSRAMDTHVGYLEKKLAYLKSLNFNELTMIDPNDKKMLSPEDCQRQLETAANLLNPHAKGGYAVGAHQDFRTRIRNIEIVEDYLDAVGYGRIIPPDSTRTATGPSVTPMDDSTLPSHKLSAPPSLVISPTASAPSPPLSPTARPGVSGGGAGGIVVKSNMVPPPASSTAATSRTPSASKPPSGTPDLTITTAPTAPKKGS